MPIAMTASLRGRGFTPEDYGPVEGRGDLPRRNGISIDGFGIVIVGKSNRGAGEGATPTSVEGAGYPSSG